MPTLSRFDPPALLTDFSSEQQRNDWSTTVSGFFDEGVDFNAGFVGDGKSQFYHPIRTSTDDPHDEPCIDWPAFPKLVKDRFPGDAMKAFETAEAPPNGRLEFQDEYLEWHVVRNAQNKITRVSFTCETTQYYEFLADSDPSTLLAIYRALVDPAHAAEVKLQDLIVNGKYRPQNKWNTQFGAVHLIQQNNNLFAEVMIAAQACIMRKRPNGTPITDSTELIRCAGYGEEGRASDPKIGAQVNARARAGDSLSLRNPVALYITRFSSDGINRDGAAVPSFWKLVRGTAAAPGQDFGMGLHLVYEVPANAGFLVGDLKIGNAPIRFGGQLAENIHVGLFALLCRKGQSNNQTFRCDHVPALQPAAAALSATRRRGLPTRKAAHR